MPCATVQTVTTLSGRISSKPMVEHLLGAGHGLLHHVFGAYTMLKQEQSNEGPTSTIKCSDTLVIRFLRRCMQEYKEIDKDDTPDAATGTAPEWVLSATPTILSCLGECVCACMQHQCCVSSWLLVFCAEDMPGFG